MLISHTGEFIRSDIWREGKYLDLWSVPHFLSGMLVGFCLRYLGLDFIPAFVIAFILLVAYEIFEYVADIKEIFSNSVTDVVVGMISFLPTYYYFPQVAPIYAFQLFVLVGIADGILSWYGWSASRKASVLEAKLRAEFLEQKSRFKKRSSVIRAGFRVRRERFKRRHPTFFRE